MDALRGGSPSNGVASPLSVRREDPSPGLPARQVVPERRSLVRTLWPSPLFSRLRCRCHAGWERGGAGWDLPATFFMRPQENFGGDNGNKKKHRVSLSSSTGHLGGWAVTSPASKAGKLPICALARFVMIEAIEDCPCRETPAAAPLGIAQKLPNPRIACIGLCLSLGAGLCWALDQLPRAAPLPGRTPRCSADDEVTC